MSDDEMSVYCAFCDQLLDEADARSDYELDGPERAAFGNGALWGAGWAFAIVGMFEAMRLFCDDSEYMRGREAGYEDGYCCGSNNAAAYY